MSKVVAGMIFIVMIKVFMYKISCFYFEYCIIKSLLQLFMCDQSAVFAVINSIKNWIEQVLYSLPSNHLAKQCLTVSDFI